MVQKGTGQWGVSFEGAKRKQLLLGFLTLEQTQVKEKVEPFFIPKTRKKPGTGRRFLAEHVATQPAGEAFVHVDFRPSISIQSAW